MSKKKTRSRDEWKGSLAGSGDRTGLPADPPGSLARDPGIRKAALDVEAIREAVRAGDPASSVVEPDGGQHLDPDDEPELPGYAVPRDELTDDELDRLDDGPVDLATCGVDDACVDAAPFTVAGLGWLDGWTPACREHAHAAFEVGASVRRRDGGEPV